ncbi:hypothetical protein H0E87_024732 [Populus deltoides]|uniref:Rhodanese domain-containing protein n=2 Tax=Populus TaxID=3689 RepID=A0A8T2X994_POPDE|nr:hypothetical protein H0E87_024732 [Populus deltoides]
MDSQNAKQRIRDTDYDPSISNPTKSKDNSKTVRLKREKRVAMAKRGIRSLAIAVALPLSLTISNLYFFGTTRGHGTSTGSISMPFWFPPPWALHLTCMSSSFLMGLSAWLVWAEGGFHRSPAALYLYLAQLGLSLAWDPIVFRMAAPWVGLLVCLATFAALVGCSRQFKEVNPIAGDLVMPCLAWASFLAISKGFYFLIYITKCLYDWRIPPEVSDPITLEILPSLQIFHMDATQRPQDVITVDVHAAKGLIASGHRYLDVRTAEEFNKSHVDNALNVPFMFKTDEGRVKNPEFLSKVASICNKDDYLVVGCNSGGRSLRACIDLLGAGFEHVTNMEGGYSAWVDSGFAGDKPAEELKTFCKFRP